MKGGEIGLPKCVTCHVAKPSPRLCAGASERVDGRNRLASREPAGLVVGGGDDMGDGVCGPPVARGEGGPRTAGQEVPGHPGDRSVQRLQLVSGALAAAVLGAFAAGHRSDDRTWRPLPGNWGGSAEPGTPEVSLVASCP